MVTQPTAQEAIEQRVCTLADVEKYGCLVVNVQGHSLALFSHQGRVYALDNRCPHMGFPLNRGTLKEGILTCHWHHARFDIASGGTFDQWADDVPTFPMHIRDGDVWIDLERQGNARISQHQRVRDGLERNIPLVMAKAAIRLMDEEAPVEPFRIGLDFGTRFRQGGWGPGLSILTCLMNLVPHLDVDDRSRALYHGLSAVAHDCEGMAPRFGVHPLPSSTSDMGKLKHWFRQFVEVRDAEGAERSVVSAIRAGADHRLMADLLFAAATDHRYIQGGHVADFTNKALEALDWAGWEYAEPVLASLVSNYANADRMEESNAWRHPVDLISILEQTFEELPVALERGRSCRGQWKGRTALVPTLLGEDPHAIVNALQMAIVEGADEAELAGTVAYAAALRLARFPLSNEFGDWDRALHTFTFANAIDQGLRRATSLELLRGVFDAAASVYLDRFLNVPAARLPDSSESMNDPESLLAELLAIFDRQQQVNGAAELVARYLSCSGRPEQLMAVLGKLLLREDRAFHTIQMVEAAFRQYEPLRGTEAGLHVLLAAARYLAAHSPTLREQGQTYLIAYRLYKGECLFEQ